jgi:hypothetical protein
LGFARAEPQIRLVRGALIGSVHITYQREESTVPSVVVARVRIVLALASAPPIQ